VTDSDDGSFPHLLRIIAEEIQERRQRSSILNAAKSPRRVGANIRDGVTKRPNEWIHSRLCVNESESERCN
jgi:hypothetical protein